jgi:hypothetical protein
MHYLRHRLSCQRINLYYLFRFIDVKWYSVYSRIDISFGNLMERVDPGRLNYYALDGDHLWTLALVVSERLYPEASVHDHSVYNRGALLLCDTISPLLPAFWAR